MFKPVFLEQFRQFRFLKTLGYLYEAFEIREKITSAKKVASRDAREDVYKISIEVQQTSDNTDRKPTRGFSLQHKTFSALNYAKDFGIKVEQLLKKNYEFEVGYTHEKSNCRMSCQAFANTLNYVSPIGAKSDKIHWQLNSKNNGPVLLFKTIFGTDNVSRRLLQ